MMRDFFQDTIVSTGADGKVTALSGVNVEVYYANTTDIARVFESYDPENMTQVENPLSTDSTGSVYFYADVGEYDILIRDPGNRVGLTSFRWNAVNASAGGIPLFTMGEDIRRQFVQIGQVIDWWRPAPQVPLPAGYVLCDGGPPIPSAEHDFTDASGNHLNTDIAVPDLRNCFVLGADVKRADGAASANGDSMAGPLGENLYAPGIGGVGGTNASLRHTHNFAHSHGVPFIDHTHNSTVPDHLHGAGGLAANDHSHGGGTLYVDQHNRNVQIHYHQEDPGDGGTTSSALALSDSESAVAGGNTAGAGATGVAGNTAWAGVIPFTTAASNTTTGTTTNSQSTSTTDFGTLTDYRPRHVGLLKLMKVRWA